MVHALVVYRLHLEVAFYDPLSSIAEVQNLLVKRFVFNSEITEVSLFQCAVTKSRAFNMISKGKA